MVSPDRQMFQREKKALYPFILFGLFDPEGLGAEAGRNKSGSALSSSDRQMFQRDCLYSGQTGKANTIQPAYAV
ncbi:hypothetical protein [Rossellomorea vietnamensis]|uniref:hypothetical protein n=1 Tax=Rossellomorea vietnamensis TaxID=218284 RepID=UPI002078A9BA|nr:hypothetical protein [Rossellomorea vietnamensis]